jgi:hypothetical protein
MTTPFSSNQRFIISPFTEENNSLNEVVHAIDKFISSSSKLSKNSSSVFVLNDSSKTLIARSIVGLDDVHEPFSIMDFGPEDAMEIELSQEQTDSFFNCHLSDFFNKVISDSKIGSQLCTLEMTVFSIDDEYRPKLRLFTFENP